MLRDRLKWALFPGLNLHARLRNRRMPRYFGGPHNGEKRLVLDAGCGNGGPAWQSFRKGNRVIGVSLKGGEISRNRRLINNWRGFPKSGSPSTRTIFTKSQYGV